MSTHNHDHRVAVVGAAGFVGRALLQRLEACGIKASAVVRGTPELSVDGSFHSTISAADGDDRFDVVVNLAYPSDSPRYAQPEQNKAIVRTVEALVRDGGRLIQVSTLAVFGSALDRPIVAGPVPTVRDVAYVESKITAEHMFAKLQQERDLRLDIVRLGNVWGYASGTWALPVVHRLLTGRAIGIAGEPGYSNTTDVANVADYLAFLISSSDAGARVSYHHLAEFSDTTWKEWIDPIANAIGVEPVYAERSVLATPTSAMRELAEAFAPIRPRSVYRKLGGERITGSWTRELVRRLPASGRSRLQGSDLVFTEPPELDVAEQAFLTVAAAQTEFRSVIDQGWSPVLTKQQSLDGVLRWIEES